jgi:hypothetical protein
MHNIKIFLSVLTAVGLTACGGGGAGPDTSAGNASTAVTFQAVASEGELVSYAVDTTALTYSYRIEESAYGLAGRTGSGTLRPNTDGTYTPSGFAGKFALLDNGLLLGSLYEDLNNDGVPEVVPVIGISNPVNSLAEAVGVYNFISRQCSNSTSTSTSTSTCINHYGTLQVKDDSTWESCVEGNLSAPVPNCQASASGGVTDITNGRAGLTFNDVRGGSMLIFKDPNSGQKVVLLDLNGQSDLGTGAGFAASQSLPTSADGQWTYLHNNGINGTVTVTGTTFSDSVIDPIGGAYAPQEGSFTLNDPWAGFVTTNFGHIIMQTGSGFYAGYFGTRDTISVGIRKK